METIKYKDLFPKNYVILKYTEEELQAAVLAEREACAKLCEGYRYNYAETIRARGEK
jgi:hypothetical protein